MSDRQINVLVGANISGLQSSLKEAAGVVASTGKQITDATTQIAATTNTANKSLQQSYRATFKDSQILAQQQGVNSAAFLEAAQKAGNFKNELDDVRAITQAMSSDTPALTAALGVGQGLAGAFAAAQGAMALFGTDSKLLQETMLKVQASIALVSGLQALGGLQDSLVALSATIKTNVIPSLVALRASLLTVQGAMIATGIGAIIVVLAAVIYQMGQYNDALDKAADAEKNFAEQTKLMNDELTKSRNENLKTDLMRAEAMKDGVAKDKEILKVKLRMALQSERELYESSNRTVSDVQRFNERKLLLEQKYQNDLAKLKSKPIEFAKNRETSKVSSVGGLSASSFLPSQEQLDAAIIPLENFKDKVEEVVTEIAISMQQVATTISAAIDSAVSAAMNGGDVGAALVSTLLGSMGNFMKQWGSQLILVGLGAKALQLALTTLNGVGAIVVGGLLVAAGAAATSMAGNFGNSGGRSVSSSSGGGGGNYSGNPQVPSYAFNPQSSYISVDGLVRGNNLVVSYDNQKRMNRRVK